MTASDDDQLLMGIKEISEYTGVRGPNVRAMMERHGVSPRPAWGKRKPKDRLALGPVWFFADVRAMQEKRLADPVERERDERRRRAARRAARG